MYDLEELRKGVRVLTADEFVAYVKAHPERFPGATDADVAETHYADDNAFRGKPWRQWPGWYGV